MSNKWVDETVRCFITDAADLDPTDPVKAIERHFERNATDELKAKCAEEKKTAAMCWRFIEAVARQALHGHNGHIDPNAIYAIAMHYFQDVPADWNDAKTEAEEKPVKTAAETRMGRPEKPKKKTKARPKRDRQGFFFDVIEDVDEEGRK